MPWVKFTQDWDFRVKKRVFQPFKAGEVKLVTTRCAEAARAAGVAVETEKPADAYRPKP